MARNLDNLGKALQQVGRLEDAEALLTQALAMRERLHKGDDPDLAKGLNNLAVVLLARRRVAEAETMQRRSLAMYQRLFSGDHPDLVSALQNLAILLRDTGRPAEAEPFEVRALEMCRRLFPGDSRMLAQALFNLGTIREVAGRAAETVAPYEEALRMARKQWPADHANVLHGMTRLATSYYGVGRIDEAIALFEEAMEGEVATFGRANPDTLMTIGNVGANYASVGRYAEALPLLEEAWRNAERYPQLRFVNWHLLEARVHLADPAKEGDVARVVALADELIVDSRATSPKGSPELAQGLVVAGQALNDLKQWDRAEPLLREGLTIRQKFQPDAWTTFNTMSVLGDALLGQKKCAEAEPLLVSGYRGLRERAATIPAVGGMRIPQALERLVRLYEATGNAAETAAWRNEVEALRLPKSPSGTDGGKR